MSTPAGRGAPVEASRRYCVCVTSSIDFTIAFDEPDEDGWIVARVLEIPGL